MSAFVFQVVGVSVIIVGLLMVLEAFIIVNSKGLDVNGELPFMVFGTLFCATAPALFGIIGPWREQWYWYLFIAFLILSGFMSYIRSRGFTIRFYSGTLKAAQQGVERALKKAGLSWEPVAPSSPDQRMLKYRLGDSKYEIIITEKPQGPLTEEHIEIVASEALWNADLRLSLQDFVAQNRKNRTTGTALKYVRTRLIIGVLTVFFGTYLFVQAQSIMM